MPTLATWITRASLWAYGTGKEKVASQVGNIVEDTIRYMNMVLVSGYALVLGFPGYLIKSVINTSVGYLDPVRTPATSTPGILTAGLPQNKWSWNVDSTEAERFTVSAFGETGLDAKPSTLLLPLYRVPWVETPGPLVVNTYA